MPSELEMREAEDAIDRLNIRIAALEAALRELVTLNDEAYSPFGGEILRDRIDRAWERARAALHPSPDDRAKVDVAEECARPEEIAAAWKAWRSRHGGKLGPGPAFVEAINAAFRARFGRPA